MKKACIIACTMAFVSAAAFAQAPSVAPLASDVLAAILNQPAVTASCPAPQSEVLFAARKPRLGLTKSLCTATANCASGTVYCEGNSTCTAVDRDCSICERGHVTCDGVTTECPTACCGGFGQQFWCCQCDCTGDCFACCRCGGGTAGQCAMQCG